MNKKLPKTILTLLFFLTLFFHPQFVFAQTDSRDNPSPFGFSGLGYFYEYWGRSYLNLLRESGARWFRGTGQWLTVQPQNKNVRDSTFVWEANDATVNDFSSLSIGLMPILSWNLKYDFNNPDGWTQESIIMPDLTPTVSETHLPNYQPGEKISYWENYIFHLVSRYGSQANGLGTGYGQNKIKYWELWNEEDISFPLSENEDSTQTHAEMYAKFLMITYKMIKRADPQAKVLIGGLADWNRKSSSPKDNQPGKVNQSTKNWLTTLYNTEFSGNKGKFDSFDILAIHPYISLPTDEHPDSLSAYLRDLTNFLKSLDPNFNKPIWISEIGFSSWNNQTKCSQDNNSLEREVRTMERTYQQALSSGIVQKVFWYKLTPSSKVSNYNTNTNCLIVDDLCYVLSRCIDNIKEPPCPTPAIGGSIETCQKWQKEPGFYKYKELAWPQFNLEEKSLNQEIDLLPLIKNFWWENPQQQITFGDNSNPQKGLAYYQPDKSLFTQPSLPQNSSEGMIKANGEISLPFSEKITLQINLMFPPNSPEGNRLHLQINTRDPSDSSSYPLLLDKFFSPSTVQEISLDLTPYRGLKLPLIVSLFTTNSNENPQGVSWKVLKIKYHEKENNSCVCPASLPTKLSGNADCNSVIDRSDLNYWVNQFISGNVYREYSADFNCNGTVDRQDLGYWINGFVR